MYVYQIVVTSYDNFKIPLHEPSPVYKQFQHWGDGQGRGWVILKYHIYLINSPYFSYISQVFETQNSSQKINLDLYPQVTKNMAQVLIFFYFHMFTIFVLSESVKKMSSSAISSKTKIYLCLSSTKLGLNVSVYSKRAKILSQPQTTC